MEIKFAENKNEWNGFLQDAGGGFLQSFEWGGFQQKEGKKIFRMQAIEGGKILLQAQIFTEPVSFKKYFYIPHGPVFSKNLPASEKKQGIELLLKELKKMAKEENCIFLRIEPAEEFPDPEKFKPRNQTKRLQPQKTIVLDLEKSDEELFKNFSRTTKYNIGLAKRHNVKIRRGKEYFADFSRLLNRTKERQGFGTHLEKYYRDMLAVGGALKTDLFVAEYQGKIISSTLMLYFGGSAITLHAGSDYNARQVKAPNLLEWEIILSAKKEGYKILDFWGIDEKKWPGLTAFKKGFAGREILLPGGKEIVFNNFWYGAYKLFSKFK